MLNQRDTNNQSSSIIVALIVSVIIIWGSYEISNQYYFEPQQQEVLKLREQLDSLKRTNDESELIKANADQLESSLADAEQKFSALKSLVPPEAELPKILDWIASKAYERALKLEHFSQGTQIKQQGAISEIPIQVEVLGYFDSVSRFVEDFARFERVLRVRGVHMTQEQQPQGTQFLTVRATISFSAYVSKEKISGK